MKKMFLISMIAGAFMFLPGCVTTVSPGFIDTSVEGQPVDDSYAYVDAGVNVVIKNPYDYYYYENGLVYHYDYYSPTRIVVVDFPPMDVRIHRHRIPDHYYTQRPPSLWRYQQHERMSLPGGPHYVGPPSHGPAMSPGRNHSMPQPGRSPQMSPRRHEQPRPSATTAPQHRSQPRVMAPNSAPRNAAPRISAPTQRHNSAPRMSAPQTRSAPRMSAPSRSSGQRHAPASRPSGGGSRSGGSRHR